MPVSPVRLECNPEIPVAPGEEHWGKLGVLQSMVLRRAGHDLVTEQNQQLNTSEVGNFDA